MMTPPRLVAGEHRAPRSRRAALPVHRPAVTARGFDGYKGHAAVDPDSEIITATVVTPGNAGDASVTQDLIDDLVGTGDDGAADQPDNGAGAAGTVQPTGTATTRTGTGEFHEYLADNDIDSRCKTQRPTAAGGMFTKADIDIDLDTDTVTCPKGVSTPIRNADGDGTACFGQACADCPLRAQCTKAKDGRTISVGRYERRLANARTQQQDPRWVADYRATRPKVERKLARLMRRRHGGRRARMRGTTKIDADFNLLAPPSGLRPAGRRSTGGSDPRTARRLFRWLP